MSVDHFLDSNIVIYYYDDQSPKKKETARRMVDSALDNENGCISYQVVQETMYVIRKKLRVDDKDADFMLNSILLQLWEANPVRKIDPTPEMYKRAFDLQKRRGIANFYDCVIAVNALDAGCAKLYTEDAGLLHIQRVEDVDIVNPFN